MDTLAKQVARAWRLMWAQTILKILSWALIAAFSICFIGMLVPKLIFVDFVSEQWAMAWIGGTALAATIVTISIALFYRPTVLRSAVEIDRRFNLRERCSSAIALGNEDRDSAIGQALLLDAEQKVQRIDLRDQFRIRAIPATAWAALPFAACIALLWVPDAELAQASNVTKTSSSRVSNLKEHIKPIVEAIQKKRADAEAAGDEEAADVFKKLEEKVNSLKNNSDVDKKKIISDLNDIKNQLQQRKEALTNLDSTKKALDGLKDLDKGPADKMAKALREQDFGKAEEELGKLIDKLKSGNLSAEQEQQLKKQLEQMKDSIQKAQEKIDQVKAETKRELEKAEREGNVEKAAALRKKMEKMEAGEKQAKALEKMMGQMQKAQDALQKGDKEGAAQALQEMQAELGEMGQLEQNSDELEEMLEELEDAKNASNCKECNGKGCAECKGKGQGQGQKGQGQNGKKGKKPGDGKNGEGKGFGDRDEQEAAFKEYDAQVRDQMRKGESIMSNSIAGPNRKGVTREETREAVLNSKPDDPDAIESISLPKAQRDQQREYFDAIRDQ